MPAGLSRLRQRRQGVLGELLAALQSGRGGRDDEFDPIGRTGGHAERGNLATRAAAQGRT